MSEQKDIDELTAAYLAGCHATRKAYEQRLAAAESDKLRLRGQLQHCIQKLSRANRGARDRNEYTDAIDSANKAIYEIFEFPKQEGGSHG